MTFLAFWCAPRGSRGHTSAADPSKMPVATPLKVPSGQQALNEFFGRYQDLGEERIVAEGVVRLCEDLGITAMDPVTLVLARHCGAKRNGEFSREEFCRGMLQLGCTDLVALMARIPELRRELETRSACKTVYAFTFRYSLDEGVRSLPREVAIELWKLLLPPHFVLLEQWLDFVERRVKNTISEDVWMMVWDLATQVKGDLSNYDDDSSWPVLLDEFVEEVRSTPLQEQGERT